MSREDVNLGRRVFQIWNEAGVHGWATKEVLSEDYEHHDPPDLPDARVVRGRDAVMEYLAEQVAVIGEMKVDVVEVREVGGKVVLRTALSVHGSESGALVPGEISQVLDIVHGKVRRNRVFLSWDEALRVAAEPD